LFATAILFGSMALFSAVTAPLVFAKLRADVAADFVRAVFSCYYLVVIGAGALAILLARLSATSA
jgi:Domain of unknown function (DUF4149)